MVSRMYNNTKGVETWVGNTLRVSLVSLAFLAFLAFLVKLENKNAKTKRREDAKWRKEQKSSCR